MTIERPDIFKFYDPIEFLNHWVNYLKKSKNRLNLNVLSKKSGLSVSNISMILNKQRPLSEKSFQKLIPFLLLSSEEKEYFNHLRIIDQSEEQSVRVDSLNQIIKLSKSKKIDNGDLKIFEYLTGWYRVAIFELVNLADFKLDPSWIQQRLIKRVSIAEIESAISFLRDHKFIGQDKSGNWVQIKQDLNCQGGIYKLSLSEFHRQIFELAHASIENVSREDRLIMGQTMALSPEDFESIKKIIHDSIARMNEANKNKSKKTDVYHIEIAAFPMLLNKHKVEE